MIKKKTAKKSAKKKSFTKESIIRLVSNKLNAVGHGIKFEIVEAGVRADGEWWYIPVISSLRGKAVKREVTVGIFAIAEDELHSQEKITVLLVPVVD